MIPELLYGLVILSAIANAVWNALVKSAGDRVLTMVRGVKEVRLH